MKDKRIVEFKSKEKFTRRITNITLWLGCCLISWKHLSSNSRKNQSAKCRKCGRELILYIDEGRGKRICLDCEAD